MFMNFCSLRTYLAALKILLYLSGIDLPKLSKQSYRVNVKDSSSVGRWRFAFSSVSYSWLDYPWHAPNFKGTGLHDSDISNSFL